MADSKNPHISFDDDAALQPIAIRSFEAATKRAAEEKDSLGIPTPVGVLGKVLYLLNERLDYVGTSVKTKLSVVPLDVNDNSVRVSEEQGPQPPAPVVTAGPVSGGTVSLTMADGKIEVYELVRKPA